MQVSKMDERPLWEHQKKALVMAQSMPNLALFFEMGTGKSRTAIEILRTLCTRNKRLLRTLILGPSVVVNNWCAEFGMYSRIKQEDVIPLLGKGTKRVDMFHKKALEGMSLTRPRIFVTNYEAMQMDALVKMIEEWNPEAVILDESQRLKNPQSVRAKTVTRIADSASNRYVLTGTPILNSPMDLYNQFRILDGGQTFSVNEPGYPGGRRPMNFYEFRATYFEDLNAGMPSQKHFPKWIARPETYEELNYKIYAKAIRVKKSECLDLPPLIKQVREIPLSEEQRRIYNEMRDEFITWVKVHESSEEPRAVVAQMALTKALRLQQIISGFAKTEDGVEVSLKENPRLDELKALLEELTPEHKVIVWATFKANYSMIAKVCEDLKIGYVELHGGISPAQKEKNMTDFRSNPDTRIVIANQAAAGIGVNLVEADYMIYYSRNFSLEQDLQSESRNYRGGSEMHDKVTRIDLVSPDTVDQLIMESLASKQDIAEQVLAWAGKI